MIHFVHLKKKGLQKVFGTLEADVMAAAWKLKKSTVKDLQQELSKKKKIAYTTVLTVADRLHKKGFLSRIESESSKKQLLYFYEPAFSREEFDRILVKEVFRNLSRDFREPLISYLVRFAEANPDEVRELQELLRQMKKQKKRKNHA